MFCTYTLTSSLSEKGGGLLDHDVRGVLETPLLEGEKIYSPSEKGSGYLKISVTRVGKLLRGLIRRRGKTLEIRQNTIYIKYSSKEGEKRQPWGGREIIIKLSGDGKEGRR